MFTFLDDAYIIVQTHGENMDHPVLEKWSELKSLVEALEHDVTKNAKGTAAAGVRARKGLRQLQTKAKELVKLTIELDKKESKD